MELWTRWLSPTRNILCFWTKAPSLDGSFGRFIYIILHFFIISQNIRIRKRATIGMSVRTILLEFALKKKAWERIKETDTGVAEHGLSGLRKRKINFRPKFRSVTNSCALTCDCISHAASLPVSDSVPPLALTICHLYYRFSFRLKTYSALNMLFFTLRKKIVIH